VVSVCTVETDSTAHNVIPQVVKMKGTVRTMDAKVQDFVEARVARSSRARRLPLAPRAEVHYQRGYPVTVNTPENTASPPKWRAGLGPRSTPTPPP
jgi:metal-dependent amidase/aminoacylase/carboxypeptidase family protein